MEEIGDLLRLWIGPAGPEGEIGIAQMGLRAVVVYLVTLAMVRLAKKRFMGRATAFDVILGIMLGSIVSRAITGNAPFVPALAAAAVLLAAHWTFTGIALRWHVFGSLIKGGPRLVVRDGAIDRAQLRAAHLTEDDLREDLRSRGVASLDTVAEARLERSGNLSVIEKERPPRIVEVTVAAGVQTIRVALD